MKLDIPTKVHISNCQRSLASFSRVRLIRISDCCVCRGLRMGEDVIGLVGIARERGNMATTRSNVIVPVDEFVRETPKTGWYISKKVAVLFFVGAAALTVTVGLAVYFGHPAQRRMDTGHGETGVPSK